MRLSLEMKKIIRNELLTDPAARGYAGKTSQEMADLINASFMAEVSPAKSLKNQPIRWRDIRRAAQSTGEWPRIRRLSEKRLPDGTADDDPQWMLIDAAINATETDDDQIIDPNDPDAWVPFQMGMQAFGDAKVLSAATIAKIMALTDVEVSPVIEERHARLMEIFIRNPVELPDEFGSYELTAQDIEECLA